MRRQTIKEKRQSPSESLVQSDMVPTRNKSLYHKASAPNKNSLLLDSDQPTPVMLVSPRSDPESLKLLD